MVNQTRLNENTLRDLEAVQQAVNEELVLTTLFNTTQTVRNATVILFELDAIGGTIKNIKFGFYLAADAAATFTVTVSKTRAGDLITFVQDAVKTWTIATPASARWYTYEAGDLEEDLQMRVSIAQDNLGNANNACDAALTMEV